MFKFIQPRLLSIFIDKSVFLAKNVPIIDETNFYVPTNCAAKNEITNSASLNNKQNKATYVSSCKEIVFNICNRKLLCCYKVLSKKYPEFKIQSTEIKKGEFQVFHCYKSHLSVKLISKPSIKGTKKIGQLLFLKNEMGNGCLKTKETKTSLTMPVSKDFLIRLSQDELTEKTK